MKNRAWLVCYPRSGSTWFRRIIAQTMFPRMDVGYPEVDYICPDIHSIERWKMPAVWEHTKKLFLIKSHHVTLPDYEGDKCVYLYRDPRDIVISEYHYENWLNQKYLDFDRFLELFIQGQRPFHSWNLHVLCWTMKNEDSAEKLLIKYEDMVQQPLKVMKAACEFLGLGSSENEIKNAIEACAFEKSQKRAEQDGVDSRKLGLKGGFGGWKAVLSRSQLDLIWEWAGKTMKRLGYVYEGIGVETAKHSELI